MAKMKKLALIGSAVLMSTAFAFGVAACDEEATHVHSYGESWTTDATHHWYACGTDCDTTVGKAEHAWNDGVSTVNGEETVTCVVCGYEKKETVATVLAVGEDTTVKVAAGAATEVVVGAEAGSYTISWTNPKTIVKVGETEYKKADSEDAEGYVGTADLLWIEDAKDVKITVATTDGSAADIVIACEEYSAPALSEGLTMDDPATEDENEGVVVAAGARGSIYSYTAMNPGRYVFACNSDKLTKFSVTADKALTLNKSYNSDGYVVMDLLAGAFVEIEFAHAETEAITIATNITYDETSLVSGEPQYGSNATISVPMGGYAFGTISNTYAGYTLSWTDKDLIINIDGVEYTRDDEIVLQMNTFAGGTYFVATGAKGTAVNNAALVLTSPVVNLEAKTYAFEVAANVPTFQEVKVNTTGVYTFASTDENISLYIYDQSYTVDATLEGDSVDVTLLAGMTVVLEVSTTNNAAATLNVTVSYEGLALTSTELTQPVDEYEPGSTAATFTEAGVLSYKISTAGVYEVLVDDSYSYCTAVYINGTAMTNLAQGNTGYYVAVLEGETATIEVYSKQEVNANVLLFQGPELNTVALGANTLADTPSAAYAFIAETAGWYTISLTGDMSTAINGISISVMMNPYRSGTPSSVTRYFEAGESFTFIAAALGEDPISFVTAKD